MRLIQRIKNLWAWSAIEPANSYRDVFGPLYFPYEGGPGHKRPQQATIIQTNDPVDDLLKTIREEDTRQA